MSTGIDRVHFEERQYLRSYDWTAEQLYHIEMRRRLNLALHLWGVVDGVDVVEAPEVVGIPKRFMITRGMAIDALGREIVVSLDYVLTDADLRRNRIQAVGTYVLSVAYRRELTTPPAPGYRLCDQKDQYTRWHESFEVLISETSPTPPASEAPGVADPLSDDPVARPWPVALGKVVVAFDATNKLAITQAWAEQRTYVGVRAQRIVAPTASLKAGTADSRLPIAVEADLLARKNAFAGENFPIQNVSPKPPPVDPTVDPANTGVVKIANTLFLKGEFYALIAGDWVTMKEYLQGFIPDVQVGKIPAAVFNPAAIATSGGADPTTGDLLLELTTRLQNPKDQLLTVAISSVEFISQANFADWENNSDPTALVKFHVDVDPNVVKLAANKYRFTIHWSIEPTSSVPPPAQLVVKGFQLSYTAVFNPA